MRAQLITMLIVALVLILVTAQNPTPVSLQFLSWEARQVPLIVIILVSLLAGMITAAAIGIFNQAKLKEKVRSLERELEEARETLSPSDDERPDV